MTEWLVIEGRNPVLEALASGRRVKEVLIAEGSRGRAAFEVEEAAARRGVPVRRVPRRELERLAETTAPQGVIALAAPIGYTPLEKILEAARPGPGLLLVCDGIVDPRNLGALIRSADAAGAHGVIVPKHRAAGLTATVMKASAGAAAHVPVAQVVNVSRTLLFLKEQGYWVAGAAAEGSVPLWKADLRGSIALVVGSEGKGLSRLVAETCDFLVSIPMYGAVSSLNASVAGAILLYEAVRQRRAES